MHPPLSLIPSHLSCLRSLRQIIEDDFTFPLLHPRHAALRHLYTERLKEEFIHTEPLAVLLPLLRIHFEALIIIDLDTSLTIMDPFGPSTTTPITAALPLPGASPTSATFSHLTADSIPTCDATDIRLPESPLLKSPLTLRTASDEDTSLAIRLRKCRRLGQVLAMEHFLLEPQQDETGKAKNVVIPPDFEDLMWKFKRCVLVFFSDWLDRSCGLTTLG